MLQIPSADVTLSEQEMKVPRPLTVKLTLTYPSSYHPDYTLLRQHLLQSNVPYLQPFQLISESYIPSEDVAKGIKKELITYQLAPLYQGDFLLSFLNISFLPNAEESLRNSLEIFTKVYPVRIHFFQEKENVLSSALSPLPLSLDFSIKLDENQRLAETSFQGPSNIEIWQSRLFPWEPIVMLFAFFLVGAVLRKWGKITYSWILARWNKTTPQERARQTLEKIHRQPLLNQDHLEGFFTLLDTGLRQYLLDAFDIKAFSFTPLELVEQIRKNSKLSSASKVQLEHFIFDSEQIRFGHYQPTLKDCEQAEKIVKSLIDSTF